MIICGYRPTDCNALAALFYHTVHTVNLGDYTPEQCDAWAPDTMDLNEWNRSFLSHITLVAREEGRIVGFGDIDTNGYLDRLYVHSGYQRMGIASALCNELEKSVNTKKIITYASITAKPFFELRGYQVIKEQQVERRGVFLTNYVMEKNIP